MFKKILKYVAISLGVLCFGAYFIHASILREAGTEREICNKVRVVITDSAEFGFVNVEDVERFIKESPNNYIGSKRSDIDLYKLEQELKYYNAIKDCHASIDINGVLLAKITQRRPLFRIESSRRSLYVDNSGYIFYPSLSFAVYVPVVTGEIPIEFNDDLNENLDEYQKEWISNMIRVVSYIEADPFLSAQIQQIDIEKGESISLYTLAGDQRIIFGRFDSIDFKFKKLMAFYRHIVPNMGWDTYSQINLTFSDQIVCTKK